MGRKARPSPADPHQSNYSLASIESADVEEVYALEKDSYPADEAATLEKIQYRVQHAKPYFMLLRDQANSIVGFVNGTCVASRYIEHSSMAEHVAAGRTLVIHSVTVRGDLRRRGVATLMLRKYLKCIHALRAVDRVLLLSKAYLLPFYLSVGFQYIQLSPVEHGQERWYELGLDLNERFGLDQWQVDAFADRAFEGNPAAVVLEQRDETWMQQVAMENNLAETSFLAYVEPNRYKLRWFTPAKEVELCGHATLAAAHVLLSTGHVQDLSKPITFETLHSGELQATAFADGRIQLSFPSTPPRRCDYSDEQIDWVTTALGIRKDELLFCGETVYDKFFEITCEAFARIGAIDYTLLGRFECRGVIVTAAGGTRSAQAADKYKSVDFVSRFFAPRCLINEDPVTGSAHCALTPFWMERFATAKDDFKSVDCEVLNALQDSPRGGLLEVALRGPRVTLTGRAVTTIKGKLLA